MNGLIHDYAGCIDAGHPRVRERLARGAAVAPTSADRPDTWGSGQTQGA